MSDLERDPAKGVWQIVGHTPVHTVYVCGDEQSPTEAQLDRPILIACDTLSTTAYGSPIGDGSALRSKATTSFAFSCAIKTKRQRRRDQRSHRHLEPRLKREKPFGIVRRPRSIMFDLAAIRAAKRIKPQAIDAWIDH